MDAILLAAGNSVRFGGNKLLHVLDGKPMYRHMLEKLYQRKLERGAGRLVVVSQYDEIFQDIAKNFPGAEAVENPEPERGISSSIRLGLACLSGDCLSGEKESLEAGWPTGGDSSACLFAVADQPYFTMESLRGMEAFFYRSAYGIVFAGQAGRRGNPVIFSSRFYRELAALEGDIGGKQVLLRHMEEAGEYRVLPEELLDFDRPKIAVSKLENGFPFLGEKGHVISFVGAGGKSTLMDAFARYYAGKGRKVIVTTTTHILRPKDYPVAEGFEALESLISQSQIVAAGADAPGHKLRMAEGMGMPDYQRLADVVLVEADGAKHFPCKAPASFEPVIPAESDIVVGIAGMDALGRPLQEACFRKEQAMELLGVNPEHRMQEEDLAKILSSVRGAKKDVGSRAYYIVLNKCNNAKRLQQAKKVKRLLEEAGEGAVVCL